MSAYWLVDYSDSDGPDFAVEDSVGELGRFFSRKAATRFLSNLRYIEAVEKELFG